MNQRVWLASVLLLVLLLPALCGLHFLFYPLGVVPKPKVNSEPVLLDGSTLFIGDLHLGRPDDSERFSDLAGFISRHNVTNVVIVGDLFNSPRDTRRVLDSSTGGEAAQLILQRLGLSNIRIHVYLVRGNHDPANVVLIQAEMFKAFDEPVRFSIDGVRILAAHGHEAFDAFLGFIVSCLAGRPYLEAWWKDVMELDREEWVVMGHTHMPDIDYSRRVANPGGWIDFHGFPLPRDAGVLVANGNVDLVQISR